MNREIKFRAWETKRKIMWGSSPFDNVDETGIFPLRNLIRMITFEGQIPDLSGVYGSDDGWDIKWNGETLNKYFILMQYTGLKDKNGKDIYEWDICIKKQLSGGVLDPTPAKNVQILWDETHNGWICDDGMYRYSMHSEQLEVIGNIYENPELLK